ncbi:M28 family metallopeptidase [Intrasporangium sp. YIM S08009]|uniref:M28 family metallopeptidase n=1 Tax=Intrasporangium zincisolvens TaxID=3080018 RepID=UPI002B05C435|nr:M28 family metallopeptidase [Intrasporangium sp. YIM S08009]
MDRAFRPAVAAVAAAVLAGIGALSASTATAAPPPNGCGTRVNNTTALLLECVTLDGVREHQAALQAIADANGGTRVSGSAGYDASVDYVTGRLRASGWRVTTQPFQFQTFVSLTPSVLQQVSPGPVGALPHAIMSYSGSGDVTAAVSTPSGDFRGCNAADWAGFPAGNIALVSRGAPPGFPVACTFALKARNALAAGAVGVVVYNNAAGPLNGTLGADFTENIGVVGIEQSLGFQLSTTPGLVLRLKTDTLRGIATTANVLAELPGKNTGNVVMAGAHLDSVNAGPGINDNGSGSAALLEVAENLGKVKPQNTIRIGWWAAEESNLVGSTYYVNNLPASELQRIALYLNFDMVGSPNHVFFVYDGDNSDNEGAGPGPAGSAQIEKTFEAFYASRGIPFKGTDFSGRSDYGPFIASNVPSGGLFTGAEGVKTAQEAALWGGTAGSAYDPCYHQACDTYANVNLTALDVNSDAIADAVLRYGMSTALINGTKSKGNFRPPADTSAPATS